MFARKLCVRLGHVHGPHDQDQQGQHKDVSRRSRNGPSRQCRWESQAADRKDAEKQKASDIEVAAQELEEGNGQKETPENVNEAEEASIDLKEIAERAVEIVNLKSEREKLKDKAEKDFPFSVKLFKKPGHIDAIMTWKFRLNLMLMASMMSLLNMHKWNKWMIYPLKLRMRKMLM